MTTSNTDGMPTKKAKRFAPLDVKLRNEAVSINKTPHLAEADFVKLAIHMPTTDSAVKSVLADSDKHKAHCKWILRITTAHERDQDKFNDCVGEMRAFVRGGRAAMEILCKVFRNIVMHYGMQNEMDLVLDACGLYVSSWGLGLKK
jgi:hypothetical protein